MSNRTTSQALRWLALGLTAAMLLGGCVSKRRYDQVVTERDDLNRRSGVYRSVAVALSTELELREQEVALLEIEQEELADEFARWAVFGAVQMQLLEDGLHLILPNDVLFASGSAALSGNGQTLVTDLARELASQPYQVAVVGFSDNQPVGPALAERYPSNWELAAARASSVVRVLQSGGIPTNQLVVVSRGQAQPISSNDTAEGRAQNRRIDVRIRPVLSR